ncbi:MAG: CHRD domain-containing protein [Gammaproteobacteria bacterium]|nr:CHRD domain-containing protein [Gammaproteobacteria bacterium]
MTTLKRATAAVTAVLLAAGVGIASAGTVHVTLKGSQETPPVKTMAHGSGAIEVKADGSVSGKVATSGIKGTMAHIHEGAPGTAGQPIIALKAGPNGTWLVPLGSKLSSDQYKEFLAGDLYVNVHSAAHPGGEIRGQLKP